MKTPVILLVGMASMGHFLFSYVLVRYNTCIWTIATPSSESGVIEPTRGSLLSENETPQNDVRETSKERDHQQIAQLGQKADSRIRMLQTQKSYSQYPKINIGIVSAFDWGEQAPYISFQARRQLHRDTWMQHPAVNTPDGPIKVHFIVGKNQHRAQHIEKTTHNITELQIEMDHYGDIVLLNSNDFHNHGKMNAWYEWSANPQNIQADYHFKLDDESYLFVDRLLEQLLEAPREKFFGGGGWRNKRESWDAPHNLTNVPFLIGWGYILSDDLIKGLVTCVEQGVLKRNNGRKHEDVYTGAALQVCGLDRDLVFHSKMGVRPLLSILSSGCEAGILDGAMVVHGGMGGGNPFAKARFQTFQVLHSIYNPNPGDLAPKWTKWESLRKLFVEDFQVCDQAFQKERHSCSNGWQKKSCDPSTKQKKK